MSYNRELKSNSIDMNGHSLYNVTYEKHESHPTLEGRNVSSQYFNTKENVFYTLVLNQGKLEWKQASGKDGKDGSKGATGAKGSDGKSAYELAKEEGFKGSKQEWLDSLKTVPEEKFYDVSFGPNYTQNKSFGDAMLVKKNSEVFYKMFTNKEGDINVGDVVFTLPLELRPKNPEFIVAYGGVTDSLVWLAIEPSTGKVTVLTYPDIPIKSTSIVLNGSYFIRK